MKKIIVLFLLVATSTFAQLKSPAEFLPKYGKQVSFYHELENYFSHLTQESKMIQHEKYGETNQGRSLHLYYISTPENLANLENIRKTNIIATGLHKSNYYNTFEEIPVNAENEKAIVWLSFNVHGNEMAAAESAMNIAFQLIDPNNSETKKWLQNTIIILDPCLNPDGYARYGNWLRDISGKNPNTNFADREHMEPWPGGRQNHYAFDLNRDWAWQTQIETQQRMVFYNRWMPHVHVDVHEMGYNEPYFFPPAAEPIHDFITKQQKDFHEAIGKNTSKKFDKNGWNYYTRERFDLFYPSYGDTYPSFNGAIGMTYEQGGIGAGRAITMSNGNLLTLQDRIDHHSLAVLTAVETASNQKEKLVADFKKYFLAKPKGKYQTYVVKNTAENSELIQLLVRNKIEYSFAAETKKLRGFHYQSAKEKEFQVDFNDLIVSANQAKGVLTQILFEPQQRLTDSLTYDITAWNIPLAHGLQGYAVKESPKIKLSDYMQNVPKIQYQSIFAYRIPWNDRTSAKVLAELLKQNIKVRSARKSGDYTEFTLKIGDLLVLKSDNPIPNFERTIATIVNQKQDYGVIETGFSANGNDLGGENFPLIKTPKVLLVSGRSVSPVDFGQVWFYFDQVIDYPVNVVDVDLLNRINFSEFTTIVLPDGYYSLPENIQKNLDSFVSGGGKIIAIQGALSLFEDREGYHLKQFTNEDEKTEAEKMLKAREMEQQLLPYSSSERNYVSSSIPGAIVQNKLDVSHPLAFGLGTDYFSLKTSDQHYKLLSNAWNVAYVPENYISYGFIGKNLQKKLNRTVTFATENVGRGNVIYMVDNPLFRGFWENGNLLFSNAVFQVD